MNRRDFLKTSALLAAGSALPALSACGSDQGTGGQIGPMPGTEGDLLLSNASIIDVRTGKVRQEDQILIRDGKISDVLAGGASPIRVDDRLDLGGAYVIPGLINAHCHMSLPCTLSNLGAETEECIIRQTERNAAECVRHGVTTVRDMLALSSWVYDLKEKIACGDVPGPRILASYVLDVLGGYFGTTLALIGDERFGKLVSTPKQGVEGVKAAVDSGAALIKLAHQVESLVTPVPNPRQMSGHPGRGPEPGGMGRDRGIARDSGSRAGNRNARCRGGRSLGRVRDVSLRRDGSEVPYEINITLFSALNREDTGEDLDLQVLARDPDLEGRGR